MGIFGDLGKSLINTVNEKASELKKLREEYKTKSDSELKSIATSNGFWGSSSTEKMAAKAELRSRGYSSLNDV